MHRSLFAFFILGAVSLALLSPAPALAGEAISPKAEEPAAIGGGSVEAIIRKGIELFTNERMEDALALFQKIIDRDREDPRGYFYKAAVFSVTMLDYKTRHFEPQFNRYIDLAIEKAESRLTSNDRDAEAHFYLGGAYGYRGIDKTMVGGWLGAFIDGTRGVFHLQKALGLNPKYYDAYYGLGAYHYWVSAKSSILWFLPFFADERARGIEELRLASDKGRYSMYEARGTLVTVLMNEKRWKEALAEVEVLLDKFPNDLSSRIQRGTILAELGRWDEVERDFKWVKAFLATKPFHGFMRDMETEYYLALAAQRRGRSKDFFERCLRVKEIMGQNRAHPYIDGLSELEARARQLCGEPTQPDAQE